MIHRRFVSLVFLTALIAHGSWAADSHRVSLASLNANTRTMFLGWMDDNSKLWDPGAKLLRSAHFVSGYRESSNNLEDWHYWEKCCYDVRGTSYYALGLLLRDAPGDRQRATDALNTVLKNQYVTPGVRWYGTFKRTPEEYNPTEKSIMWRDYDPNWREFIGSTLEIILIEFPNKVPAELKARLYSSINHAVAGEMAEGRLVPTYTNPSLMYGSMWDFAAAHDNRADWKMKSSDWIENLYKLYSRYRTLSEFNSPTYDFVDLYGIGLWRQYGSTDRIRFIGMDMESGLWNEIASLYQPELHNISGPYDRSYFMDMENDGGSLAAAILMVMDVKEAPLASTVKLNNLKVGPAEAALGTHIPADAVKELMTFQGPHLVRKQVSEDRIATAWIGKRVIFGGESTNKTRDVKLASGSGAQYHPASQFHPVTVQWRTPSGEIGWIRIAESPMIDATADQRGITISTSGTLRFRMHAKGMSAQSVTKNSWDLPGLRVNIKSGSQEGFKVEPTDPAKIDPAQHADLGFDVIYPGVTIMRLDIKATEDK